ncbi:MAG TPA: AMP-binding protein, partial [Anaerolineales bacterium]
MDYRPVYRDRTPRHSESMIAAYVAQGYWGEQTILERFRQIVAQRPDKEALIEGAHRFTYRQLNDQVEQTRQGLAALGLQPGDLIAVQLPNWWEQIVASLAIIDLGAVLVPVSIRLRGELKYILEFTAARAIVLPEAYHGFDHVGLVSELKPALPDLEHLVVPRLGRDLLGVVSFDRLQRMSGDSAPPAALDPN